MPENILVAYATKHGSTREVAEAIAGVLRDRGAHVTVQLADEITNLDGFSAIVLGGALYTGRWHRDARHVLARFEGRFAGRQLAIFALGPKSTAPEDIADSRSQLDHTLDRFPEIKPVSVAVFGGVIDPTRLHFPFSHMPASDARDWREIRRWAKELAEKFGVSAALAS